MDAKLHIKQKYRIPEFIWRKCEEKERKVCNYL